MGVSGSFETSVLVYQTRHHDIPENGFKFKFINLFMFTSLYVAANARILPVHIRCLKDGLLFLYHIVITCTMSMSEKIITS
jgi:hypothetical protein